MSVYYMLNTKFLNRFRNQSTSYILLRNSGASRASATDGKRLQLKSSCARFRCTENHIKL